MECLNIILPVLPHSLALICDKKVEVKADHVVIQSTGGTPPSSDSQHKCPHHSHDHNSKSSVTDAFMLSKPRQSIYPMIPMNDAIKMVLDHSDIFETETKNFMDSLSYVSAENIYAKEPLPHFRASVKDGFALKLPADYKLNTDLLLKVVGTSNAGDTVNLRLHEGECVKINTGAFVPSNADAVIQIEDTVSTSKNDLGEDTGIKISNSNIVTGQDIREIGSDIAVGEIVVKKSTEIVAAQIGICATVGVLNLKVFKKPIVGVISTGNELVSPSTETLCEGKIRDSNKSLLVNACKQIGIQNVIDAGIAQDNSDSVLQTFKAAIEKSDVIISTGGVSMGDKDLVKDVLVKDLKCELHFARLNMKPGKPTTFATVNYNGKKKLLFCLPGNPVSAIVTFNLLVVPSLKKLMGYENPNHTRIHVKMAFDAYLDPRPEYHRCLVLWNENIDVNDINSAFPIAHSTGNQHSSRLLSMNQANCLLELPGRTTARNKVNKGEILTALLVGKF